MHRSSLYRASSLIAVLLGTLVISAPHAALADPEVKSSAALFNHFLCYQINGDSVGESVTLSPSQLGSISAVARRAQRLCAPADAGGDPSAPGDVDHLTGYSLGARAPFTQYRDQVIVNQFGTLTADLVRPELLLVPTGKSTTGPPPAYAPAIDHFECFRAVRARFRRSGIDVVDQFGTRTVNVRRPTRLCVPVDKDGSGITDPTTSLMCYRVSGKPRVNRTHVFTTNQLGSDEYDVGAVRELCVPSQLNPGGPTMTPNVTATPVATETPGAAGTATPIETAAVATPTPTATPTAAGPTPTATPTQTPAVATPTPTVTLTPSATATPACGDGTCDPSEDPSSCSADCPPCTLTTTIAPSPPYFRSSQIVIDAALSESCGDSSTWSFSWMSCVDSVVVSSQSTLIFPPDTLAAGSEYCLEVSATPPVGSTVQPPSPAQVHFRIEES